MIRVRVDDFPNTKDGEKHIHTLAAYRSFHQTLSRLLGNKRYILGVIPKRCSPDDLLFLRNETDCVIGMHGITHDETQLDRYQNEFPPFISQQEIGRKLLEASHALDEAIGRRTEIYMPPRNRIDHRTVEILHDCGFYAYTTGPETPEDLRTKSDGPFAIDSQPPHEYGRTDEMWNRGSHEHLWSQSGDRDVVLTLHWTWETNVGLHHMTKFLSAIGQDRFEHFDA